jgi:hypothetical protein
MGAGAADFGGLVSAFHLDFLTERTRHLRLYFKETNPLKQTRRQNSLMDF